MAIPFRGHTGQGTYFITASAYLKQQLLQSEGTALLFVDVLYHYRGQGKYLLHEFVVMPDHFHLLIAPGPQVTLERAMQFIKGGYSYRVKKGWAWPVKDGRPASTITACETQRSIRGSALTFIRTLCGGD